MNCLFKAFAITPPPPLRSLGFCNGFIRTHCIVKYLNSLSYTVDSFPSFVIFSFRFLYGIFYFPVFMWSDLHFLRSYCLWCESLKDLLQAQDYKNMHLFFFLFLLRFYPLCDSKSYRSVIFPQLLSAFPVIVLLTLFLSGYMFCGYCDCELFFHHLFQTGYCCFKEKQLIVVYVCVTQFPLSLFFFALFAWGFRK